MPRKKATEVLPSEELSDALAPDTPSDASGSDTLDVPDSERPEKLENTPKFPAALPGVSEPPSQKETASDASSEGPEQTVELAVSFPQRFPDDPDYPFDENIEPPADSGSEGSILPADATDNDSLGLEEAADDQDEIPTRSSEEPPSGVPEETPPAKPRRASRRRTAATEPSPLQPAARQVSPSVLSIDAKAEVETEEYREDTIWHEIRNAYRTRRILTGTLGGVEQTEDGKSLVIVEYKGFRVVIPAKEMMLSLDRRPTDSNYAALMRRCNQILSAMMGAEIDFIVRGIDNKTRSIVASRKEAMLRKRQTFYLDQDASGEYRITPGRLVQARVTAVSEKVIYVEAFGVECAILARDLSWDWVGDAHDRERPGEGHPSATALRALIRAGEADRALELMPPAMAAVYRAEAAAGRAPVFLETCERAVLARLRSMTESDFAALDQGREGLYRRLYRASRTAPTLETLLAEAKTKRYAHARLRRMALWAYLGLCPAEVPAQVPYLRVLAADALGRELLAQMRKTARLPILTKPGHVRRLDQAAQALFALEARGADLYALAYPDLTAAAGGSLWREGPAML